jgi:tetratricopeptide (TPR) repeat protein
LGVWNSLESRPLDVQEDIVLKLTERLEYLGQYANLAIMKPVQQLIDNFTGRAKGDPRYLVGDHVDQNVAVTPQYARESPAVYIWSKFYSMVVAFVFGDYSLALRYNEGIDALYTEHNFGAMDSGQGLFFDCLVLLAAVQEQPSILLRKRGYIRKRLKQFQSWAKHSTENFYGRLHLLNAEFAWATNDHLSARSEYKLAILHSRDRGILMMEALSYERAGRYYWRRDQKELAMEHFQNAVARYETWGGSTKVHHLQKEMDTMLGKES